MHTWMDGWIINIYIEYMQELKFGLGLYVRSQLRLIDDTQFSSSYIYIYKIVGEI